MLETANLYARITARPTAVRVEDLPKGVPGSATFTGLPQAQLGVPMPPPPLPAPVYCGDQDDAAAAGWDDAYRWAYYARAMLNAIADASAQRRKCLWDEEGHPKVAEGYPYPWYWFGPYQPQRMQKIRSTLNTMVGSFLGWGAGTPPTTIVCSTTGLDAVKQEFGTGVADKMAAICESWEGSAVAFEDFGRKWILICSTLNPIAIAGLILHEIGHHAGVIHGSQCDGQGQPHYGSQAARLLALQCPDIAPTNTDNFRYFAKTVGLAVDQGTFSWGGTCPPEPKPKGPTLEVGFPKPGDAGEAEYRRGHEDGRRGTYSPGPHALGKPYDAGWAAGSGNPAPGHGGEISRCIFPSVNTEGTSGTTSRPGVR